MKRLTLGIEFVTPCFVGGAGGAEWRAPSIRGELRWWFRALAGARFGGDPARVRAAEARVFGATDESSPLLVRTGPPPEVEPKGGPCGYGNQLSAAKLGAIWKLQAPDTQDRLAIYRKDPQGNLILDRASGKPVESPSNPVHYLGYGPILWVREARTVCFLRERFEANRKAEFTLQWGRRLEISEEILTLLVWALWAWLNLGGIGARSRRGFGSLVCTTVGGTLPAGTGTPSSFAPANLEEFRSQVQAFASFLRIDQPQNARDWPTPAWSHFSPGSWIGIGSGKNPGTGFDSWQDAMIHVGTWLIAFRRRYGYAGDGRTVGGESLALRDYDWAAPNGANRRDGYPERAGFGLPLPFGQGGETVTWGTGSADKRRASPLLIHIAKFGTRYYPVLTYLPAKLLPGTKQLRFKGHSPARGVAPSSRHESIVSWFLDDLHSKSLVVRVL